MRVLVACEESQRVVLEVMERLDAEQHRRELYEFIQARKRGDEPCMSEV